MRKLLFALSDVYNNEKYIYPQGNAADLLTGNIISNRIVAIAYDNIEISSMPKETKKALDSLRRSHIEAAEQFFRNMRFLCSILENADFPYALLKGAFLSTKLYEVGYRTSNDIDVLIESTNVSSLQNLLRKNGFIQGTIENDNSIKPASRKDIITAKLNYGETVPWGMMLDGKAFELDINFSIDYKPDLDRKIVANLLKHRQKIDFGEHGYYTLSYVDFLIHLCCHLYKEATVFEWVQYRRDLQLYKFSDINIFLHAFGTQAFFDELTARILELQLQHECYYTFVNSGVIYPNILSIPGLSAMIEKIKPANLDYMNQIYNARENAIYAHHMNFDDWFFCENRVSALRISKRSKAETE